MDDIDFIEDQLETRQLETSLISSDEKMRLKVAFGDDVAQRFLKLRGITSEVMQEAVLEKYASKQAARMARDVIATALYASAE